MEEENDKKWWDIYLRSDVENKNFQEWKAEKSKQQNNSKVMNKNEKQSLSDKFDKMKEKTYKK
jgi:hypothetical protein